MVACAAVSSQSRILLAVPMSTCALTVDQLKTQLLAAIENGKHDTVCDVLAELEKIPLTKEILESSRVGAIVNDVRKRVLEQWPDVSKRCRSLIKLWQKLVETRAGSSCASSANATPNLVSPGAAKMFRKVTPCTPAGRRVSSTGIGANGRGSTVSPANGYAPGKLNSPNNGALHKSQSVGGDLAKADEMRNGKRKPDEHAAGTPSSLKRTKTAVGSLAVPTSVSAARLAVQSTTELVAQLSQDLPERMSIDSSIRQHEEKVKREQQDEELALALHGGPSTSSPYGQPERKKRKYERKQKVEPAPEPAVAAASDERRGGLVIRLPRLAPVKETPAEELSPQSRPESSTSVARPPSRNESTKKVDWLAMLPSLDVLRQRAKGQQAQRESATLDPTKVHLMKVRDRDVLALPYLDVPSKPDFLTYRYPNPSQYYSEENFAYGALRDV